MVGLEDIAIYLCHRYFIEHATPMSEMKLHKLLYLVQRESYVETDMPIGKIVFEPWKFGPVSREARKLYKEKKLYEYYPDNSIESFKGLIDRVYDSYASKNPWSLSSLTLGECSWNRARKRFEISGDPNECLYEEDIREDAARVRLRRFLIS